MGVLLKIEPELHFGFGPPFEIEDQFNGPHRGTWWFRSKMDGELHGPFENRRIAAFYQDYENFKLERP